MCTFTSRAGISSFTWPVQYNFNGLVNKARAHSGLLCVFLINGIQGIYSRESALGIGLFDGTRPNTLDNLVTFNWNAGGVSVDVRLNATARVWRSGCASYTTYKNKLKIEMLNASQLWQDVSFYHVNTLSSIDETAWEAFTVSMPPGLYRFSYLSAQRIDSEWFIEGFVAVLASTLDC